MRLFALVDREELGFTTYSFFAALAFFYLILFDNRSHSKTELATLDGLIESYVFENGNRGAKYYSIRLKDLTPGFKLPADFIDYFDLGSFYGEVESGKVFTLYIAKADVVRLQNANENIFIYGLSVNGKEILSSKKTTQHSNVLLFSILSGIFLVSGLVNFIIKNIKYRYI